MIEYDFFNIFIRASTQCLQNEFRAILFSMWRICSSYIRDVLVVYVYKKCGSLGWQEGLMCSSVCRWCCIWYMKRNSRRSAFALLSTLMSDELQNEKGSLEISLRWLTWNTLNDAWDCMLPLRRTSRYNYSYLSLFCQSQCFSDKIIRIYVHNPFTVLHNILPYITLFREENNLIMCIFTFLILDCFPLWIWIILIMLNGDDEHWQLVYYNTQRLTNLLLNSFFLNYGPFIFTIKFLHKFLSIHIIPSFLRRSFIIFSALHKKNNPKMKKYII